MSVLEKAMEAVQGCEQLGCPMIEDRVAEEIVRAVLTTIRIANEKIYTAGWAASVENEGCTPECCWPSMIDSILSERTA